MPSTAQIPVYPVKIGGNRRHFVDQADAAIFWLGTTQWELFRRYTPDEARLILARSRAHGFCVVQVMLLGVGDGTGADFQGQKGWIDDDPRKPNEAYFAHVDAVVKMAADEGLLLQIMVYHQRYGGRITAENARQWGRWLGARYQNAPNIVWSMNPKAQPEYIPVVREVAAGLRQGDGGGHLITLKPDPSPYSSSFIHSEPWLDFNSMQTWKDVALIYPMVSHDYALTPAKPVVMAEGAYENGSEYGFEITPLIVRRQAYYSYFAGGYHAYGHNDSWRVLPTWKTALDAPGAAQMGVLRKILTARNQWWRLTPDQSILAEGGKTDGDILRLASRHEEGLWAMVYLADPASVSVRMNCIKAGQARAFWMNPVSGDPESVGTFPTSGTRKFTTPPGWTDALLVLEADQPR